MTARIRIIPELVTGDALAPGDLWSNLGPDYWDNAARPLKGIGQKVFVRTNAPNPPGDAGRELIYRLRIVPE